MSETGLKQKCRYQFLTVRQNNKRKDIFWLINIRKQDENTAHSYQHSK